jgi:segregation and condensation protein B
MDAVEIKYFVEAALLAAGRPLSIDHLQNLFDGRSAPAKAEIRAAIAQLNEDYEARGILITEVASGFRIQIRQGMADRLQKLWEERAPRYSRALFETLALIAYRQPITRGEIEEIRGVAVSSNIVRSLLERNWVHVVGHRDVPGRPEMFGTTRAFLDYFGLKKLDDLPPLADLADWESLRVQLDLPEVDSSVEAHEDTVTELPVLYPDLGAAHVEEAATNDDNVVEMAESEADIPELPPVDGVASDGFDELVVREWPDPVGSAVESTASEDDEGTDKDASASSG